MTMAGSDSSLSSITIEILRKLKTLDLCLDLEEEEEPTSLFNRILSSFIKETRFRPIPPLLGDGKRVDLPSLYCSVVRNGGYESVTAGGLWDSVAESIGCRSGSGSSVKLIFFKYFDELCRCLVTKPLSGLEECSSNSDDDADVVVLDPVEANRDFTLLKRTGKRKREPLVGMLDWLLLVARNPCDCSIGIITGDGGRDGDFDVGLMFSQALMARHAIFFEPKRGYDKIHPLTNGESNVVVEEKIKHSKSLESMKTRLQCSSHSEITITPEDNGDHNHGRKRRRSSSPSEFMLLAGLPVPPQTDWVRVGPSYQVEVPVWTATASVIFDDSCDPKWLGTKIWPPEKKENRLLIERDPICKGRNDNCGCQSQGSCECVRFHVREKRNRLELELGPAFHGWGFDRMGEGVALSWTEEEERKFKAVVRLNRRCVRKNLWNHLFSTFPDKGRKKILSYYFNVFLLRERSYQNRATPEDIDSD